jgi:RND family efflux transporter MFP subunit
MKSKLALANIIVKAYSLKERIAFEYEVFMRRLPLLALFLTLAPLAHAETTVPVERRFVDDRKAVIATVQSVRDVQARARINGTVTLLNVREGDEVKAGDKIALIGDAKLGLQNQGLAARYQAAQAAATKAKLDFARVDELRKAGFATQAKFDESRAALQMAENALEAAGAEQKVVLQQASEGAVLAPSAGRVLRVPVTLGSVVMAGEVIAALSQENYVLRLELPERHAKYLHVGDGVLIAPRGIGEEKTDAWRTGTVKLVYPEIKDGRVMADVTSDGGDDYFVGERARVLLPTGRREALFVPTKALIKRGGVPTVLLAGGGEVAVQTGLPEGEATEILGGLNDNDTVIVP